MSSKKMSILLIEDDPDIAKAIAHVLRKYGYLVHHENDGKKGLNQISAMPDLIILDLMLPTLSGEEVCKAVRENDDEAISRIPIIMLTAKSTDVDRIVGKVIGANVYMTKPFSMEDLMAEVERLIRGGMVKSA